ncbi:MAG TPA: hypothetical protein VFB51_03605 [Solirubrobacterales bacterium]|nr:hypothetical protein [Solirubrobacterales bacterium]
MATDRDPLFDDGQEREAEAEKARSAARPYSVAVGVLFLGLIVFAGVNSLSTDNPGPVGLEEGRRLPAFAAPSATGTVEADSNVDSKQACKIRVRDAIRICDYFDRPLVLVAWFSKCGGHCEPVLDSVERIRERFPDVAFVGVDIRNSLDEARKSVQKNGWGFPMAVDRDGAVGLLYSVGVGPTTFFAYPGGVLASKALGELSESELVARVRRLEATARERRDGARIRERRGS